MELQFLSLNGQLYCILMENVIIGWTYFIENTFLSLLLLFSLVANCKLSLKHRKLVELY